MLKIGDFSKLSRISIRMLRHYDDIGLLTPASVDRQNGYRYYTEEQLLIGERIMSLKNMGFGLTVISDILTHYGDPQALAAFLAVKQTEMRAEISEANVRMRLLETTLERLRKDDTAMEYAVTLKTLPARDVVSVRMVIPSYQEESILWNTMMKETGEQRLRPAETPLSVAIFHDKEYKESGVDVEIQSSVQGKYKDTEHVKFKTTKEILYASATYRGGYDQITPVNRAVATWIRDNGYTYSGPMFCIYHVSPAQTSNPDELVTEVCYPVRKAAD